MPKTSTINEVAKIFCQSVKEVLESSTRSKIRYAPTIQKVPSISLKPDLGCFVQFTGDYTGLFIMNFSGQAALELYQQAMKFLGLPEEELAKDYTADDVVNFIGEMVNQIIGNARRKVEAKFGLLARNNQPKAITITSAITLSVATMIERPLCRRLAFRTQEGHSFYVEMNMEQTEFIPIEDPEEAVDIDTLFEEQQKLVDQDQEEGTQDEIDALLESIG